MLRFYTLTFFILISCLLNTQAQEGNLPEKSLSRYERKQHDKQLRKFKVPPDLSDPVFIDYHPAIIYMTPYDTLQANSYLRKNFTDQYLSHYEFPGRVYPASRIFGFKQSGKYYRACRFDEKNAVFGELLVKGEMNLYYCRKLPREAGLVEFVSSDPQNTGYRNFMIAEYRDKARYANDYMYFVVMNNDSLNPVPVRYAAEFAGNYLRGSPGAYLLMMQFNRKKTLFKKILPPALVAATGIAVVASGSIENGLIISFPLITGGLTYSLLSRDNAVKLPSPEKMREIVGLYNSTYLSE